MGVFVLCAVPTVASGGIEYTIADLGTLGGPTSVAIAISQNGIVVGNAMVSSNHPFLYKAGKPMQDLGLLDPVNGIVGDATSVNSNGQVVGESDSVAPASLGRTLLQR